MEITITINGKPVQATVDDAVIRDVMSENTSEKMTGYERNYGGQYYYQSTGGHVDSDNDDSHPADDRRYQTGNYLKLSDTLKSGEAYKIYAKLRDTLRQRRDAKNENDLLLPLYECLMKNPDIVNQLNKALGTTRTKAEVISKRKYSARTDVLEQ